MSDDGFDMPLPPGAESGPAADSDSGSDHDMPVPPKSAAPGVSMLSGGGGAPTHAAGGGGADDDGDGGSHYMTHKDYDSEKGQKQKSVATESHYMAHTGGADDSDDDDHYVPHKDTEAEQPQVEESHYMQHSPSTKALQPPKPDEDHYMTAPVVDSADGDGGGGGGAKKKKRRWSLFRKKGKKGKDKANK